MKILTVLHDFRAGGAEKVAVKLANQHRLAGNDVAIFCVNKEGPFVEDVDPSVNIIVSERASTLFSLISLVNVINILKPDLIISHLSHVNSVAIVSSLIAKHNCRVLVVEHSMPTLNFRKGRLKKKIQLICAKLLYKFSDRVICVSDGVADDVKYFTGLDGSKVRAIYNPVIDHHLAKAKESNPNYSKIYDLVFLGRLIPSKRVDIIIDAVAILKRTGVNLRVAIVGDGPSKQSLQDYVRLAEVDKNIEFLGFMKNPYRIFSVSETLILTSDWEGLPTVLIEALFFEKKVIARDCRSGPREILDHGRYGLLIDSDNPKDFADAIMCSINLPLQPSDNWLRQYTVEFSARKYLEDENYTHDNT